MSLSANNCSNNFLGYISYYKENKNFNDENSKMHLQGKLS